MKNSVISLVAVLLVSMALVSSASAAPVLWLKADAGVISDTQGVATWEDQSATGNDAIRVKGTMQAATRMFPIGEKNVIRFNKDGFFSLDTASLRLADLTVCAVVEQTEAERRVYFSTYSNAVNWGYGVNLDMEGSGTRAFTSAGSQATISDWWTAGPSAGMHLLTTTISSTLGTKSIYADGALLGGPVAVPGISYYDAETASIGTLGQLDIDYFFFRGDIAEIIILSGTDVQEIAGCEEYLMNKYFIPEPMTLTLLGVGGLALIRRKK